MKYYLVQKRYKKVIKRLKKKVNANDKITVGYYVLFDSVFSAKPLFEKMLLNETFEPFIVVIPDTSRGQENMFSQLNKSYQTFMDHYSKDRVLMSYDERNDSFIDFSDKFDMVYLSNPYDFMTHEYFRVGYLKNKDLLTFHTNYGFFGLELYTERHLVPLPFFSLVWKVFTETEYSVEEFKQYQGIKGRNVSLTGYCKLDEFSHHVRKQKTRKSIIIAPHHTILDSTPEVVKLSNFLKYFNFFLTLPQRYPDIDFVFRPHPLLFVNLIRVDVWGEEKTNEYLSKLLSNGNVVYSDGGSYYDIFINSDAMIHDCSSFTAEYMVTGNPCCYMLKSKSQVDTIFKQFGKDCLEFYHKAYNEFDILHFIDSVVIKGQDEFKKERNTFVNDKIKVNYPNVAEKILQEIKEAILA